MKLTSTSEKAIAVIAYLTLQQTKDNSRSIDIASRLNLSDSYTKKILRKLVVAGIIDANSGTNGGYHLAKEAKDINLLMIIEAMEGQIRTYPEHGVLSNFIKDYSFLESAAQIADFRLREQIIKADDLWREQIKKITLAAMIEQITAETVIK